MENKRENIQKNTFVAKAILLVMLLICSPQLFGQGWEILYDDGDRSVGVDVIETTDGGFLTLTRVYQFLENKTQIVKTDAAGNIENVIDIAGGLGGELPHNFIQLSDGSFIITGAQAEIDWNIPDSQAFIMKADADGNVLWYNIYGSGYQDGLQEDFRKIVQTPDGGFISVGRIFEDPPGGGSILHSGHIIKVDGNGNQKWYQTLIGSDFGHIISTADGNYILTGRKSSGSYIRKINLLGEEIWNNIHNLGNYNNNIKIIETPDQHLIIAGSVGFGSATEMSDIFLRKLSPDGEQVLFTQTYSKPNFHEKVSELQITPDGGFAIAGTEQPSGNPTTPYNQKTFLIKTNSDGEKLWRRKFGNQMEGAFAENYVMRITSEEGFILAGLDNLLTGGHQMYLIKTDLNGWLYGRFLSGNVFNDLDISCNQSPGEIGMQNWIVSAYGENEFHANTDEFGNYFMEVGIGAYNVVINYPSAYWEACESPVYAEVYTAYDTVNIDFPVQAIFDCPFLTVDIGTPFLRWCNNNYYTISYCNKGTIEATDAYVEVTLDGLLTVTNSSFPIASQIENTYTFNVGNIEINECDYFVINVELGCDVDIQGTTHCTEAHIFPDSLCGDVNANWDGSSIEVEGICQGDSITFIITNIGDGDMSEPGNFFIVEDQIMMFQSDFILDSGQSTSITIATTGRTFRIEAGQAEGHPGNSMPSAIVEGCGQGPFSLNFTNAFSLNDADNYLDIDCTNNISSFDPNDKLGIPIGYGEENFIRPGTEIDYRIRFQNTGTDTAFQVVLKDNLSPWLDMTSIRLGASSHEYDFEIEDNNTLIFTFDNIMLPDSNVNEVASHGFVKFKVSHVEDIPLGTQIKNMAGIYFDSNPVVLTNETLHTVEENFIIIVSVEEVDGENSLNQLSVFPNPATDYSIFETNEMIRDGQFNLLNANGQLIRSIRISGNQFRMDANDLPKGMYFFQIEEKNNQLFTGKIMIQ